MSLLLRSCAPGIAALLLVLLLPAPAPAQIAFRAASQAGIASTAPPAFQAAGTAVGGTGNVTPTWPAHQADDIALLFIESTGGQAANLSVAAGFVEVANSPQATGGGTTGTRLTVYWARATSGAMPAPTVADPGNHVYARILTYRGVVQSGDPWDVTGGGVKSSASGSVTVTGVTTTVTNTLVVQAVARDNDSSAAAFSAQTNANLTGIAERSDAGTTAGNGGGFGVWDGVMAAAGATGNTTANVTSSVNAFLTIALLPAGLRLNVPAGTVAGDVMVASVAVRPDTMTITPPAGWTPVRDTPQAAGTTSRMATFYRVATVSEPAFYVWTFSGGSATGATGGIVSFSGVDTSAPIDAEGGNTTPSGTSHTANAITTTVADTMLVASFEYTSTPTDWTPPAGMTEAVDQGSITPPNDAGIKLEMAYQVQAAAGGTGAKTATSVGAAADTGVAHLLALRPLVVVVTPGSFNAFETTTAAGAITGVIRTKVAGTAFSLDVVAIQGGAQQAAFTDQVIVELLGNNTLGVALDAQNCPTSFTLVQTVAPNPTITGGRSTVSFAAVANSWRDVRVRVRWPTSSPTVTSCSTDNFAIRPNAFANFRVRHANWQTAGLGPDLNNVVFTAGGELHKAGRPFSVRADALNSVAALTDNYTGSPTATITACGGAACTSGFGTLTLGTAFAAGQLASDAGSYNEVGSFSLQLIDDAFASVDAADGSTVAERRIASPVIDVGRFVPDHFAVALNAPTFGTACGAGGFTYVGQAFNYTAQPVITVTARDSSNNTTALYAGAWFRITNASLTGKSYTAATGSLDVTGLPGTDPVIAASGGGTGTLTFGSGTGIFFTRAAPVAPFDADISLAINVIDADGVAYATNPARFGQATPGNGIAFTSGKPMRFGRLRLSSANGSQLVPLPVPLETQHWNGTAFVTNAADSCTTLSATNIEMSNFQGSLGPIGPCKTTLNDPVTFTAGRGNLRLTAPGSGNDGSVDLTVHLGASGSGDTCPAGAPPKQSVTGSNKLFLQGNWTGGAYDQNPTARARFGVYKGAEEVIFIRENF